MFNDPNFFTLNQLEEIGLLPLTHLPAYGIMPYFKRMNRELTGIEIGVLKGENVNLLLKECSNIKKLVGIDPFAEHTDHDTTRTDEEMKSFREVHNQNTKEFGDRYELIEKKSVDAIEDLKDQTFDFILLDGDHSYEGIMSDLNLYYPLLKTEGYIFIHDNYAPYVQKAIKDFRSNNRIRLPLNISKNFLTFWIKK